MFMLNQENTENLVCPEASLPEANNSFSGLMEGVTLGDLVQLSCLENKERVLRVRHREAEGEIFFADGDVTHAATSSQEGEAAFFEIMNWRSGTFELRLGKAPSRTIRAPWNFLLLEAYRQLDEGGQEDQAQNAPVKVLVVDDSKIACKALKTLLKERCQIDIVCEASNGREALKLIEKERPDLVTLDMSMPVMGGDQTLKHIMVRSPAPVILVSGHNPANMGSVMEFLRLGAVDFVPKPMDDKHWEQSAARLERHVSRVKKFRIANVRRARTARVVTNRPEAGGPADRLAIFLGGPGGLLELQKILAALPEELSLAALVLQDMADELVMPCASYLNRTSPFHIQIPEATAPVLNRECWLANWKTAWRFTEADGPSLAQAAEPDPGMEGLLESAADIFGRKLAVFVLSGCDLPDMESGLQKVVAKGGRILLQQPESCLDPEPIRQLQAWELEDSLFEPERVGDILKGWASGEDPKKQ